MSTDVIAAKFCPARNCSFLLITFYLATTNQTLRNRKKCSSAHNFLEKRFNYSVRSNFNATQNRAISLSHVSKISTLLFHYFITYYLLFYKISNLDFVLRNIGVIYFYKS